jgi:hypothetical protein
MTVTHFCQQNEVEFGSLSSLILRPSIRSVRDTVGASGALRCWAGNTRLPAAFRRSLRDTGS